MAINKVTYAGETLLDLTDDTVTEDTLAEGYTAHDRAGNPIMGKLANYDDTELRNLISEKANISSLGTLPQSIEIESDETGNDYIIFAKVKQYDGLNSTNVGYSHCIITIGKYNAAFSTATYIVAMSSRYSPYLVVRKIAGGATNNSIEFGYYITVEDGKNYYNYGVRFKTSYRSPVNFYPLANRRDAVAYDVASTQTEPTGWTVVDTQTDTYISSEEAVGDNTHPVYVSSNGKFEACTFNDTEDYTSTLTWVNTYVTSSTAGRTSLLVKNGVANLKLALTLKTACSSASSYVTIGSTTYKPKVIVYGTMQNASGTISFPVWINTSGNIVVYAKGVSGVNAAWYANITWIDE